MDKLDFAEWLSENRKQRFVSQRKLAKMMGVNHGTVHTLETGKLLPSPSHIIAAAKSFRFDEAAILRQFGVISPSVNDDEFFSDLVAKLSHLTDSEKKEVEMFIDFIEMRKTTLLHNSDSLIDESIPSQIELVC